MPAPHSTTSQRWDTWPSTKMRLRPSVEQDDDGIEDFNLSYMDEDPLTYFLTPAPAFDGGYEEDLDMMDFDAGIEDAKRPAPIVRSVSPSSLEGLARPPARPPTPPRSSRSPPSRVTSPDLIFDMSTTPPTPDFEDEEDFIRFTTSGRSHGYGLPFSLREFAATGLRAKKAKEAARDDYMLSPASSFPAPAATSPSSRGRSAVRPGPRPISAAHRTRSFPSRLSPHSWREPSPDVWSIEEETENDLHSDMGESAGDNYGSTVSPIDILAAKPKKRVRFVLPAMED